VVNLAYKNEQHTHTNYQRSYNPKRDQLARPKRLRGLGAELEAIVSGRSPLESEPFFTRAVDRTPPLQKRHRKPTTTGNQPTFLTNRKAAPRKLDKGRARSKPCRRSPKNHLRHNHRRASCCGLQDGVFKKSTTPKCRHRPIRGFWVFT
jgi:hypothetical protein